MGVRAGQSDPEATPLLQVWRPDAHAPDVPAMSARKTTADLQGTHWSPYSVTEVEGARVALAQCLLCGATVLLDPRSDRDFLEVHHAWHFPVDGRAR